MAENSNVSVGNVTQADLNFNESQREQAFQEFMTGNPFGAPPRADQLGLTAQNPDEAHLRPKPPTDEEVRDQAEARLNELYGGTPSNYTDELAEWKKKYGDRENEFGALRREKAELQETLELLLSQQAVSQPTDGRTFSTGYQPQYSQPQNSPGPNEDPFEGIDDNTVLEGHQIKRLMQRFVAPALQANFAAAEESRRELAAMKAQAMLDAKKAAGIAPLDELRLRAKYPVVASMPDGPEKFNLMKQLIGPKEAPVQAPVSYSAPTAAAPAPVRTPNVVQRLTHVESSNGSTGEPDTNPNLPFQVEMAAAERQPFHLRAEAMQKVLTKYKVPTVNAFGVGRYKI